MKFRWAVLAPVLACILVQAPGAAGQDNDARIGDVAAIAPVASEIPVRVGVRCQPIGDWPASADAGLRCRADFEPQGEAASFTALPSISNMDVPVGFGDQAVVAVEETTGDVGRVVRVVVMPRP